MENYSKYKYSDWIRLGYAKKGDYIFEMKLKMRGGELFNFPLGNTSNFIVSEFDEKRCVILDKNYKKYYCFNNENIFIALGKGKIRKIKLDKIKAKNKSGLL